MEFVICDTLQCGVRFHMCRLSSDAVKSEYQAHVQIMEITMLI